MVLGSLADMLHALLQGAPGQELRGVFGSHLYSPQAGAATTDSTATSAAAQAAARAPSCAAAAARTGSQAPSLPLAGEQAAAVKGPAAPCTPQEQLGAQQPAVQPVLSLELLLEEAIATTATGAQHAQQQQEEDRLVFEPPGRVFKDTFASLQRRMVAAAGEVPRLLLDARLQVRCVRGSVDARRLDDRADCLALNYTHEPHPSRTHPRQTPHPRSR